MDKLEIPSAINNSLSCKNCGALLHFAPGTHELKCDYCGESNIIEKDDEQQIISYDYDEYVASISTGKHTGHLKVVKCNGCGSQSLLDEFVTADTCAFCTAPLVLDIAAGQEYVTPHYVLPFHVTEKEAIDLFKKWIRSLWWSPNDLKKKLVQSNARLKGIYIPHWAYDADTVTRYTGERGDYYYTTETYTETVNGKTETRTRQVRHTRWSYASGTVYCTFKDETIPASRSLPEKTLVDLGPWNFGMLVKFDERYMSGFRSETYQVTPQEGFIKMTEAIHPRILDAVRDDIGGDEQRVDSTDSKYNNKGIKYTMLPVWMSAYKYKEKIFQFKINASTGEVIGERPLSIIKIVLAILLAVALIVGGIFLYNSQQQA
ncbi:hypothetical protein DYU05_04605 [Mucilaginibacter terrenus]|uniref:DNA helicase PriA n=1 Tax=Mucilaginibacter terrenus TaxID=2482727 RepID=A0A3E2NVF1_9SPHI|nr:hypothetical protein [Mucilaginibacter terrenus]RFZ84891.1 hypothetical protein DYU05_04605 [Mucilaginibacter terrenus]